MESFKAYRTKYKLLLPNMPERPRRLMVAADAKMIGRGGVSFVQRASGISRVTIIKGIKELEQGTTLSATRNRRSGGGRKKMPTRPVGLGNWFRFFT